MVDHYGECSLATRPAALMGGAIHDFSANESQTVIKVNVTSHGEHHEMVLPTKLDCLHAIGRGASWPDLRERVIAVLGDDLRNPLPAVSLMGEVPAPGRRDPDLMKIGQRTSHRLCNAAVRLGTKEVDDQPSRAQLRIRNPDLVDTPRAYIA